MLTLSIPTRYASLRHCAVLRSQPQQQRNEAVAKNRPLMTGKSGFTDTDPCNIFIIFYNIVRGPPSRQPNITQCGFSSQHLFWWFILLMRQDPRLMVTVRIQQCNLIHPDNQTNSTALAILQHLAHKTTNPEQRAGWHLTKNPSNPSKPLWHQ